MIIHCHPGDLQLSRSVRTVLVVQPVDLPLCGCATCRSFWYVLQPQQTNCCPGDLGEGMRRDSVR